MTDSSLLCIVTSRIDKITCLENTRTHLLFIQRDDLIHPIIAGNKWRKLNRSIAYALENNVSGILTYGGAFSNHLIATAEACRLFDLPCTLMVRGEELRVDSNPYLAYCHRANAQLSFINRSDYKTLKSREGIVDVNGKRFLSIPEGGANRLGVEGCMDMVRSSEDYNVLALAQGTTTTSLGLLLGSHPSCDIWCFPVLKGFDSLREMEQLAKKTGFLDAFHQQRHRLTVFDQHHLGGYAKHQDVVLKRCEQLSLEPNIALDPIYTGKAFLGLLHEMRQRDMANKKVLFIHTGGVRAKELL
jgi:1-aminocyclopropane-1-carboxylate deaminase